MDSFHFLRPAWLLAFLPLLLALWRLYRTRYRSGALERICDAELLPYLLLDRPGAAQARAGLSLTALGGALAIIALAGPVWERIPMPVFRNEDALVIVLDVSTAMDATDLKPSRLDRARYKIADLLRARRDGQTGLVVYAGDAFTVTPLTDDTMTITSQLGALSTVLSPVQGQRADLGLESAIRLLTQGGVQAGHVLLMTSEVDPSIGPVTARRVKEAGFDLSVLGVGTEAGGPVPRGRKGLWKDAAGNILVPKLDVSNLRRWAEQGGGLYRTISSDSSDIDRLSAFFDQPSSRAKESSDSRARLEQWIERGPWLLLALLPIAALAFRRGGVLMLVGLVSVFPQTSRAFEWQDLWSKPDRRAEAEFESQRYEAAARQFSDPAWKGAAWYRAGKYQEALNALKDIDTPEAWYNQGNALAQLGKFAEAIAAYRKVLEREPGHADAKYNKEWLEQFMKKKEQKESSSGNGDQQHNEQSSESEAKRDAQQSGEQGKDQQAESQQNPQDRKQQRGNQPEDSSSPQQPQEQKAQQNGDEQNAAAADEEDQPPKTSAGESEQAKEDGTQSETELSEQREMQQANEQWLRRIPDDPGGLLRRKFAWQYRQRQRLTQENEE